MAEQTHLLGTLGKPLDPFPGPRDLSHLEPVLSLLYWLQSSDIMVSSGDQLPIGLREVTSEHT